MKKSFLILFLTSISYLSQANILLEGEIKSDEVYVEEASDLFDNWSFNETLNTFTVDGQFYSTENPYECDASASGSLSCGMGFSACGSDGADLANQIIDLECFACGHRYSCDQASIRDFGFWVWYWGGGY